EPGSRGGIVHEGLPVLLGRADGELGRERPDLGGPAQARWFSGHDDEFSTSAARHPARGTGRRRSAFGASLRQAELRRAGGPGAVAATAGVAHLRRDGGLLLAARLLRGGRVLVAAAGVPGALAALQAAPGPL